MPEEKNHACGCGKNRTAVIIVALILLSAIIITAILRDRFVNQQFKSVTVTGQGKVSYIPDIAIVTLGVQIDKAAKAEDALAQLNSRVSAIIKEIKTVGIGQENIQTQNYSLYPQYDYKDNISVVSGYNANQQLVVKVTDYDQNPDLLNQVIAAASKAGANQVNSLSFDASNMNDLKQEARLRALADAKSKSGALADAAGVKLKDINGWYENLLNSSMPYTTVEYGKGGLGGAAVTSETPAGDREVVIEVGLTYNIK